MTQVTVLGLSGSPRRDSSTRILLDRVLAGAASAGARTLFVDLCRLRIKPCIACNSCYGNDRCMVRDDFQPLFDQLILAERIVLAAPIYFMGLPAQAKAFVDRCQCLWARKYVQKLPMPPTPTGLPRKGYLIATAGSAVKDVFLGASTTFRYFLDALDAEAGEALLYSRMDTLGPITQMPDALDAAFARGIEMVR